MSEQSVRHLVAADTLAAETKREPWVTIVCPAGRAAVEKALGVSPRLGATEMRVVLAVVDLTVLWSKLKDEVYLQQIADLANVGADAPDDPGDPESVERWTESRRKATSRALRRMAQLGILLYKPGKGKGNPSLVGIPQVDDDVSFKRGLGSSLLNDTNPPEPEDEAAKRGLERSQKGAGEIPKGGRCAPLPERDPEDLSENPERAGASDVADDPPDLDELRAGLFEHPLKPKPPPGRALLEAVARAAPNPARPELLDDVGQAAGRAVLCELLAQLEVLVGFDAAVTCVAGEWPAVWRSAMALAIARARRRLGILAAETPASPPPPPRQATLEEYSPPQPPVWAPPAETARSPPPPGWRDALPKPTPRSEQ